MVVLILIAVVAVILLRTLRKDFARYAAAEDDLEMLERDLSEESGWKLVHGDVFRPPPRLGLLSAVLGTGLQLAGLELLVGLLSVRGMPLTERGSGLTIGIIGYLLTTVLSGYVSGMFYSKHEGADWVRAMLLAASMFPVAVLVLFSVLNTVAIFYGSLAAVPLGSIVLVLFLWLAIAFPLSALGFILGKNSTAPAQLPCRVKRIPSPIPDVAWYIHPYTLIAAAGLMPFISIFIEMYYVFHSFWNYQAYVLYEFLLLVFVMLLILSVCVAIVSTYVLLNSENYRWWWHSVVSGGSITVYVFAYAVYFYFFKTNMSGLF